MQSKNAIEEDQHFLSILKTIATAYQEISVMKMKEARNSIEHSRLFVSRLKDIFETLKYSYPVIKDHPGKNKSKPSARVLVTANSKFHGDILKRIFNLFLKDETEGDIFVVGRIGKDFLREFNSKIEFTHISIPDDKISTDDIKNLITKLFTYQTIHIYYAQFKTVVQQEVIATTIPSIYTLLEEEEKLEKQQNNDIRVPLFLFEPSGEIIADFLDENATIALVRQTLYETQLARYASRIKAMDQLLQNIDDNQKSLKREKVKINRSVAGKKQQERLSGIFQWHS